MVYFDLEHPTGGKWENLAQDPRERLTVYYNGDDIYINVYDQRERMAEFLHRIIKRLKHERETLNESLKQFEQYADTDNEKIKKAVERSRRYLIEPIERNRKAAAQLFHAITTFII